MWSIEKCRTKLGFLRQENKGLLNSFPAGDEVNFQNGLTRMVVLFTWRWECWLLLPCLSGPMTPLVMMTASRLESLWSYIVNICCCLIHTSINFEFLNYQERKWWCFLLSSIFTFIMGVVSVLLVRALASIFCRKVRTNKSKRSQTSPSESKWVQMSHCKAS